MHMHVCIYACMYVIGAQMPKKQTSIPLNSLVYIPSMTKGSIEQGPGRKAFPNGRERYLFKALLQVSQLG